MRTRQLIPELEVSALGLGCMGMSEFYGPRDDTESLRVLHRAADLGVRFFDTADMYGPYHNEELVGRFIREHGRDGPVIATKFGIVRDGDPASRSIDNSPAYIRACCEASLKRLGLDRIDLYYVHRYDRERPIEEVISTLADLKAEGKIAHIGLSEVSADTLRRAHQVHPVAALQTEYSLWTRDVERTILPACRELGVGFVAYSPLGRGFLTGTFDAGMSFGSDDFRAGLPRFTDSNLRANGRIVDVVRAIASRHHASPAQVALAWLLAKGDDIVPIPGTKRLSYLEDNAAAIDIELSSEDMRVLDAALILNPVAGERYGDLGMSTVNS